MQATHTRIVYGLFLLAVASLCHAHPLARPICDRCIMESGNNGESGEKIGDENVKYCKDCTYGHVRTSSCREPVCRKGPGDSCGGRNERWGVCGEGLACSCGVCTGCSLDSYDCYPNPPNCVPRQTTSFHHREYLNY